MTKKKSKLKIFGIVLLIIILLGLLISTIFFLVKQTALVSSIAFKWKGLEVTATSDTSFKGLSGGGDKACSWWGGIVSPLIDTDGAIHIESYSSFGKCSGNGASASVKLIIPNPQSYKSVFIIVDGYAKTQYTGTSNCPSAGTSIGLSQKGGNSINLASVNANCVGTDGSLPSGILLNIQEDFIIVPSSNNLLRLNSNEDLTITFGTDAGGNTNGRSGRAVIDIQSIELIKKETICPTTYTPVCTTDNITFINECSALSAGKNISYSGECRLRTITIKPDCSSCPSETRCIQGTDNVICLKEEVQTQNITLFQNNTIVQTEVIKEVVVEEKIVSVEKTITITKIPPYIWWIIGVIGIIVVLSVTIILFLLIKKRKQKRKKH